ncbi:MAG: hypothetical protein Q7R95_10190 [bacterium]|nr:hypothetical protein [bacterium]
MNEYLSKLLESAPFSIYIPHKLLDSSRNCPDKTPHLDISLSRQMQSPVYSCSWTNPPTDESCGKKFDVNGNEIRIG